MNDFCHHLSHHARRFPAEARLYAAGWTRRKHDRVRRRFPFCNFSLILSGRGSYRWRGELLPVVAPAVLTQWPKAPMDYGPEGTWSELYLIYPPETEARFRRLGLLDAKRPIWAVAEAAGFLATTEALLRELTSDRRAGRIDRIDRLAEDAVVDSLLSAAPPLRSASEQAVLAVREAVDVAAPGTIDPEAEARRHGLSPTHFRRLWRRLIGVPPARYVVERRVRAAAHRLVEEDLPVRQIAADLGFPDQLYFSRRFRSCLGISPAAYRQRARVVAGMSISADRTDV